MGLERSGSRLMRSVSLFPCPRKEVDRASQWPPPPPPSQEPLLWLFSWFCINLTCITFLHSLHPAPDLGFTPAKFQCEYCPVFFFDPSLLAGLFYCKQSTPVETFCTLSFLMLEGDFLSLPNWTLALSFLMGPEFRSPTSRFSQNSSIISQKF